MTSIMRKIMIAALSLAMVACFMPQMNTPVYATDGDPAMVAGAESVLKGTANTDNAQTVWYAGKTWFVISFDGTGNEYTKPNGAMTLLLPGVLGHAGFNEASNPGNDYEGSNLQTTVNGLYESLFSDKEKKAVMIYGILNPQKPEKTNESAGQDSGKNNTPSNTNSKTNSDNTISNGSGIKISMSIIFRI